MDPIELEDLMSPATWKDDGSGTVAVLGVGASSVGGGASRNIWEDAGAPTATAVAGEKRILDCCDGDPPGPTGHEKLLEAVKRARGFLDSEVAILAMCTFTNVLRSTSIVNTSVSRRKEHHTVFKKLMGIVRERYKCKEFPPNVFVVREFGKLINSMLVLNARWITTNHKAADLLSRICDVFDVSVELGSSETYVNDMFQEVDRHRGDKDLSFMKEVQGVLLSVPDTACACSDRTAISLMSPNHVGIENDFSRALVCMQARLRDYFLTSDLFVTQVVLVRVPSKCGDTPLFSIKDSMCRIEEVAPKGGPEVTPPLQSRKRAGTGEEKEENGTKPPRPFEGAFGLVAMTPLSATQVTMTVEGVDEFDEEVSINTPVKRGQVYVMPMNLECREGCLPSDSPTYLMYMLMDVCTTRPPGLGIKVDI